MTVQPDPGSLYAGQFETSEIGVSRQESLLTSNAAWTPEFEMHPEGVADLEALPIKKTTARKRIRPKKAVEE